MTAPVSASAQNPNDKFAAKQAKKQRRKRSRGTTVALGLPLMVSVLVLLVGLGYVATLPTEYTATSTIAFDAKQTDKGTLPGSDAVSTAAGKYTYLVDSASAVDSAAAASGMTKDELKSTAAELVPSTGTLSISVSGTDAAEVSSAANAFANQVLDRAKTDPTISASTFIPATPPVIPSGPQRTVLTVVTVFMAVLLGAGTLVLTLAGLRYTRQHPKGERLPEWLTGEGMHDDNTAGTSANRDSELVGGNSR